MHSYKPQKENMIDYNLVMYIGLGLIIGGAIGNVIDRAMVGAVVDFLDFHAADYHWPAFNVADMGITCGAAVLIWDSVFGYQRDNFDGEKG